jgi:transcriptional regulator with XRE-family HTH domain
MARISNNPPQDLPAQLRAAIDGDGRSARELAAAAGVDASQINRFLTGERDLRLATAGAICDVLGLRLAGEQRGRGRPAKGTKSQRGESRDVA